MDKKKISFGFKTTLKLRITKKKEDNELIECLEGQSIKIIGKDLNEKPKLLVIPLKEDANKNKLKAAMALKIMQEEQQISEGIAIENNDEPIAGIKNEAIPAANETLEQKAAREIINSLKEEVLVDETKVFELPLKPDELPLDGAAESTMNDYEEIPIKDYGMAMLRGMGYKEDNKVKGVKMPDLRPRGMGLGADKMIKAKTVLIPPRPDEILELKRNAYVKILAGKNKDLYGQIEGFDDETGRINVKLTIGNSKETLNEFMLQPVSKQEWTKYGKVINVAKYEEYKAKDLERNEKNNYKIPSSPSEQQQQPSASTSSSRKNYEEKYRERSKSPLSPSESYSKDKRHHSKKYTSNSKNKNDNDDDDDDDDEDRDHSSARYKKYHKDRRRSQSFSSSPSSSEDSDCDRRKKSSHKSSKSKKSSSSHRHRSRSRSRDRRYHSNDNKKHSKDYRQNDDENGDSYHHKKKTKKSKKQRSRSKPRR